MTIEARRADYSLYAGSPELPLHARLPVRVLAGSVYCIRALFVELGNDKPMKEKWRNTAISTLRSEKVVAASIYVYLRTMNSAQPDHGRESPARARRKNGARLRIYLSGTQVARYSTPGK